MLAPGKVRQSVTMDDFYDQLQRSRLFSCLSDPQTMEIIRESSVRRLPARSPIGAAGEEAQSVYLLLQGRAKVCYMTPEGKQPILYFVGPDELIGEQSIFTGKHSEDHVETIESSRVACIPTRLLRGLALGEPAFTTSLSELVSRRRSQTENRIRHLLFLSNRERLTHLLLDLAEQHGAVVGGGQVDLDVKLSHQDLANFIGSTRETVTVVLGKMQSEGLLTVRRRRITLLKPGELATSVDRTLSLLSDSPALRQG